MAAQIPTPEALALSANVFTSQIASWIPASFAPSVPPQQAESDWQSILRSAGAGATEGKERLGLGHPSLNAPKAAGYGQGIKGLEKSLKKGKMAEQQREAERDSNGGAEKAQRAGWRQKEESESEEESRSSMVGKKRKGGAVDLLAGKGKKKAKANGGGDAPTGQIRHLASAAAAEQETKTTATDLGANSQHASTAKGEQNELQSTEASPSDGKHIAMPSISTPGQQPPPSQSAITATAGSATSSPTSSFHATSTWSTHPLLLQHDSKLSKNARKKARQRAKKAAALHGES